MDGAAWLGASGQIGRVEAAIQNPERGRIERLQLCREITAASMQPIVRRLATRCYSTKVLFRPSLPAPPYAVGVLRQARWNGAGPQHRGGDRLGCRQLPELPWRQSRVRGIVAKIAATIFRGPKGRRPRTTFDDR